MLEINQIYNGDCLDLMKSIPDKSMDMICTDLPYEVLRKNNPHAQWDRIIPFEPLWEQYERIIKDNGAIVLFAQGMFTAKLMMSNQKLWRYNLVWDKCRVTGFLNANRMPMRCHEDICVFYKSWPTYNPQYEDGEPNHPQGNGKHKETNRCYGTIKMRTYEEVKKVPSTVPEGKKMPKSIISIPTKKKENMLHPTAKSVELIRYLIRTYTNEGETVLDSCCGSGTTAIAAIREKRNWICIEKSEEYFNIAKKRIETELSQPKLF